MAERLALTVKNILFGTKWVEFTERKQIHSIYGNKYDQAEKIIYASVRYTLLLPPTEDNLAIHRLPSSRLHHLRGNEYCEKNGSRFA